MTANIIFLLADVNETSFFIKGLLEKNPTAQLSLVSEASETTTISVVPARVSAITSPAAAAEYKQKYDDYEEYSVVNEVVAIVASADTKHSIVRVRA